jgi:hypothetical protein
MLPSKGRHQTKPVRRASTAGPLFIVAILALLSPSPTRADESWWDKGWAVTGIGGVLTTSKSSDIWLHGNIVLDDDTLFGLAVSKVLFSTGKNLDWEFEQQAVKHFGGQNNWEFNSVLMIRWKTFPWDSFIDTSLAFGDGISIATDTPDLEVAHYGANNANAILNFVLAEFTFALPDHPNPELVMRMQHRSGAFGLIDDTWDASTAFAWGLKVRF